MITEKQREYEKRPEVRARRKENRIERDERRKKIKNSEFYNETDAMLTKLVLANKKIYQFIIKESDRMGKYHIAYMRKYRQHLKKI